MLHPCIAAHFTSPWKEGINTLSRRICRPCHRRQWRHRHPTSSTTPWHGAPPKKGSILIDVHSVASWYAFGGAYSASKAALWSATNSLRIEFAPMGVHVTGVHMGYVDTDMAAHADGPKMLPTQLVTTVYDAVEAGEYEVLADELTQRVKAALSGPVEALYPDLHSTDA